MKPMFASLLATSLLAGLIGEASAAKTEPGYNASSLAARHRPARKYGREYDFPRFGSERWWELQEDRCGASLGGPGTRPRCH
jgi:hypothetical protein